MPGLPVRAGHCQTNGVGAELQFHLALSGSLLPVSCHSTCQGRDQRRKLDGGKQRLAQKTTYTRTKEREKKKRERKERKKKRKEKKEKKETKKRKEKEVLCLLAPWTKSTMPLAQPWDILDVRLARMLFNVAGIHSDCQQRLRRASEWMRDACSQTPNGISLRHPFSNHCRNCTVTPYVSENYQLTDFFFVFAQRWLYRVHKTYAESSAK